MRAELVKSELRDRIRQTYAFCCLSPAACPHGCSKEPGRPALNCEENIRTNYCTKGLQMMMEDTERLTLTTYTEEELTTEAKLTADRAELLKRLYRPLQAKPLDTTGDMLDPAGIESDLGLFTRRQ